MIVAPIIKLHKSCHGDSGYQLMGLVVIFVESGTINILGICMIRREAKKSRHIPTDTWNPYHPIRLIQKVACVLFSLPLPEIFSTAAACWWSFFHVGEVG